MIITLLGGAGYMGAGIVRDLVSDRAIIDIAKVRVCDASREKMQALAAELDDPRIDLIRRGDGFALHLAVGPELRQADTALVTTGLLGNAKIPGLPYENADGSPLTVDTDCLGRNRDVENPTPGPFESPGAGPLVLTVR